MSEIRAVPSLYEIAAAVSMRLGVSIIPLTGKRPPTGFAYKQTLRQAADANTMRGWFATYPGSTYGIVCGTPSGGLLVLDFDAPTDYEKFTNQFPPLASTYTVRTRRGMHVYLRAAQAGRTRKIPGGDWQANGAHVVGAGSVIEGVTYTLASDTPIRTLTPHEYAALQAWAANTTGTMKPVGVRHALPVYRPPSNAHDKNNATNESRKTQTSGKPVDAKHAVPTPDNNTPTPRLPQLAAQYQRQASAIGRNNALYQNGRLAAKQGIPYEQAAALLIPLHVLTPPNGPHAPQSSHERQQEARDTLTSAYRRAHTPTTQRRDSDAHAHKDVAATRGLPNIIREKLLSSGTSLSARLLEAFCIAGWQPETTFTTAQAVQLGAEYGIGRASVLAVLSGHWSIWQAQRLIPTAQRGHETERYNRHKDHSHSHNSSKFPPAGEGDKTRLKCSDRMPVLRGRTPNLYRVPTLAHLQAVCQVADTALGACDPLTPDDLRSEKAYRLALHRTLIARTTPELSQRWHARRLGVSARTIQRYNRTLGVIATPIIAYTPLTWGHIANPALWPAPLLNTQHLARTPGRWLQAHGQRYPAIRGLGAALLKHKRGVILCEQRPSRLQLPPLNVPRSACIWRRADGTAPDWVGGLYDDPLQHRGVLAPESPVLPLIMSMKNDEKNRLTSHFASFCDDSRDVSVADFSPPQTVPQPPDDLTQIKGIGAWRARLMARRGILHFATLAQTDPHSLKALTRVGEVLSVKQAAFWVAQAQALAAGRATLAEVQAWSYRDWTIYQFERGRRQGARGDLRTRLDADYAAKGWAKYGDWADG